MPDVLYTKKTDAIAYQKEVGGQIVKVEDADGTVNGWKVLPEIIEGSTRGPNPSELPPSAAEEQKNYLRKLAKKSYSEGGAVKGKTFRGSF